MGRWDILRIEVPRNVDLSQKELPTKRTENDLSVGRGASYGSADHQAEKRVRTRPDRVGRLRQRDGREVKRGEVYPLRERQIRAMTEVGTFRTVDASDLAHFAYVGHVRAMNHDLRELRSNGLIEERLLTRAQRAPRRVLALTEKGHRLLAKASDLPQGQVLFHGFGNVREIEHDADLYKVYQTAAAEIRAGGGKPIRVRLDFELRAALERQRNAGKSLPAESRAADLAAFASRHSLGIVRARIRIPDLQIEYETPEGDLARTNLELISENYRLPGIRGKALSGFTIYARGGDAARIRRALEDTHTVKRILSI